MTGQVRTVFADLEQASSRLAEISQRMEDIMIRVGATNAGLMEAWTGRGSEVLGDIDEATRHYLSSLAGLVRIESADVATTAQSFTDLDAGIGAAFKADRPKG